LFLGAEDNDYAVPVKDIEMEAGKPYRLRITAKGQKARAAVRRARMKNPGGRSIATPPPCGEG
jgi:hypothetical protein